MIATLCATSILPVSPIDDYLYFFMSDGQKSVLVIFCKQNTSYTPFGKVLDGGSSRFDYEGKEFDSSIGQYDFHFRGYRADWGKFTQPDTLLPNVYDPQQLNRYAFERNDPLKNIDLTGHYFTGVLAIVAIVIVVWLMVASEPLVESQQNERNVREHLPEYKQDTQGNDEAQISIEPAMHSGEAKAPPSMISAVDNADLSSDVSMSENKVTIPASNNEVDTEDELRKGYYKRLKPDDKGQLVVVTFNSKDQEVGGSYGGEGEGSGWNYDPDQDCYCVGTGCSWNGRDDIDEDTT